MKMISKQMIVGGGEAFNIVTCATSGYRTQLASGVSVPAKKSVPQPYDRFGDLESARLMEERYGIKEEGLF